MVETSNAEACKAMGLKAGTRVVACCVHGQFGRPEDVHELNNWAFEDGGGIRCVPDHPYCFRWASPDLNREDIGPDYCLSCGAFIGDGGMIERSKDNLCVECDEDCDDTAV